MKEAFRDVMQFMRACDQPIGQHPAFPPSDRIGLRLSLNLEEMNEITTAIVKEDLEGVADGIADLVYVLLGMAVEFGIDLPAVWKQIQDANIAKASAGKAPDGKQLKPDGWQPPDIASVLYPHIERRY